MGVGTTVAMSSLGGVGGRAVKTAAGEQRDEEVNSAWNVFQGDSQRTGYTKTRIPESLDNMVGHQLNVAVGVNGIAVGNDGVVYTGAWDKNLYAFSPNLQEVLWTFPTNGQLRRGPAVGPGGNIYFGSRDGIFRAVSSDGELLWEYNVGDQIWSYPTFGPDGTLYFAANDLALHALDTEGELLWKFEEFNDWPGDGVSVTRDGELIVLPSWDGSVYGIDSEGEGQWSFETGGPVRACPPIGPNGDPGPDDLIFAGSTDGNMYALTREGELEWEFEADGAIRNAIPLHPDGRVHFGTAIDSEQGSGGTGGTFYTLDTGGDPIWEYKTASPISGGIVDAAGSVFFGVDNGEMFKLNRTGDEEWIFNRQYPDFLFIDEVAGGELTSVGPDGTLYFGADHGYLFGIQPVSEGME
jgi:outer membrane protein assembly factor BamB